MALNPRRAAVASRRMYAWEREMMYITPHMCIDMPIAALRALGNRIWRAERKSKPLTVVAGNGDRFDDTWVSYCQVWPDHVRVELARDQRNLWALIHEVTHGVIGNRGYDHGPAFVECYLRLLKRWGGL